MFEIDESAKLEAAQSTQSLDPQPDAEPPDPAAFLRAHPEAQKLLEELREQYLQTRAPLYTDWLSSPRIPTIGQHLSAEFEGLSARVRKIREIESLAKQRAVDLTADQLRTVLRFMA